MSSNSEHDSYDTATRHQRQSSTSATSASHRSTAIDAQPLHAAASLNAKFNRLTAIMDSDLRSEVQMLQPHFSSQSLGFERKTIHRCKDQVRGRVEGAAVGHRLAEERIDDESHAENYHAKKRRRTDIALAGPGGVTDAIGRRFRLLPPDAPVPEQLVSWMHNSYAQLAEARQSSQTSSASHQLLHEQTNQPPDRARLPADVGTWLPRSRAARLATVQRTRSISAGATRLNSMPARSSFTPPPTPSLYATQLERQQSYPSVTAHTDSTPNPMIALQERAPNLYDRQRRQVLVEQASPSPPALTDSLYNSSYDEAASFYALQADRSSSADSELEEFWKSHAAPHGERHGTSPPRARAFSRLTRDRFHDALVGEASRQFDNPPFRAAATVHAQNRAQSAHRLLPRQDYSTQPSPAPQCPWRDSSEEDHQPDLFDTTLLPPTPTPGHQIVVSHPLDGVATPPPCDVVQLFEKMASQTDLTPPRPHFRSASAPVPASSPRCFTPSPQHERDAAAVSRTLDNATVALIASPEHVDSSSVHEESAIGPPADEFDDVENASDVSDAFGSGTEAHESAGDSIFDHWPPHTSSRSEDDCVDDETGMDAAIQSEEGTAGFDFWEDAGDLAQLVRDNT